MVDKYATGLKTESLSSKEEQFATSYALNYKYFGIKGDMSVPIFYYFGQNNKLDKIEISVSVDTRYANQDYNTIKGKIEKYYNAVCKVSATKSKNKSGDDEILTRRTANNVIRIGDDYGKKEGNVIITITPNTASNSSKPTNKDAGATVSYNAFTFNKSVFNAQNTLITWFENIGKQWN